MRSVRALVAAAALAALSIAACAAADSVRIDATSETRCVISNGIPDHDTGTFPNAGNPHSLSAQSIEFCVPAQPEKGDVAQEVGTPGIALNGIVIRPGTADYYDASSPRGFSRDPASGWNLEGMGARELLGLDSQNAHVDERGLYHYHGVPPAMNDVADGSLIGYAADGFEIHYVGDSAVPSYRLKSGTRPSAPGGAYDGTYNEDWEYVRGLGNLDECKGATVDGQHVYFATDGYPFFPRCLWGTEITEFR